MSNNKQSTIEAMFEARANILRMEKEIQLLEAKEKQEHQNLAEKASFAHPLVRVTEDDGIERVVKLSRYAGYVPRCEMKQNDVEELIEVLCFWIDRLRVSEFWANKDNKTETAMWWRQLGDMLTNIEDILRCEYEDHADFEE